MQAHCESWPIIRPRLEAAMAARRDGLRRLRRLAAAASPRPTPSAARSRWPRPAAPRPTASTSRRAAPSSTCAWRACTASPCTASAARTTCCWTSRATSASAPGDFVMSPPLRSAEHRAALWAGLLDGTLEVAAADHAAWPAPIKAPGPGFLEAVHGAAGNGLLLPLLAAQVGLGRGLRLGARRAPHAPRTRRASSACPTRARSRRAGTPISSCCIPATSRPCRRCRPTGRSTTASSAASRTCRRASSCSAAACSRATGAFVGEARGGRFVPGVT